ncbi:MlaD family protein [Ramlibacter sp. H39-3-26]|uniref:MlaD family protein n=1 Tax=Curvibacter soli TaxID=3031331 RepID=UPI0023DCC03E|nr:MlaD family protein [Ramlibacter sp. H39-3-26]MDF1486296.1 MlaD family protein [Ramlibacter sp. H39-3-26]
MENKSHALAAGAFVICMALLLMGLALWLMRDQGNYASYELSTRDGVSGLQPQAAVRYKGVAVGKVTQIGFDPQVSGNVLIRISVDEKAPVSPTTFATLGYQGVTGLAYVLLDDDAAPQPQLPPGNSGLPRLPLRISGLGKLSEQAPLILAQVDQAVTRINQLLQSDNQKTLIAAIDNMGRAAGSAAMLAERLQATLERRLDPVLATMPELTAEAARTMQSLQAAAARVSDMSQQITATAQRLNEKDGALEQLAQGTRALAHAADTFATATLPRINRVTDDASRAARQLGRTVGGINDNPQSLIFGNGVSAPGPGEPGFAAPAARP